MAISLSNVCFSYPEKNSGVSEDSCTGQINNLVINIPTWSLAKGEHAFIYGPSGCGKSTLLNVLNGLLCADKGDVKVLGNSLNAMSQRKRDAFRANNIGYVFQQFNLIPYLNAFDNIRLANHFAKSASKVSVEQDITTLLNTLNISEKDRKKPVRTLSIGQQQRIAIARALINKPALLIADEPTSSLDKTNTDSFMALLMSVVKSHDITLLFVSHDMSLAQYFNRVESLTDINIVVNQAEKTHHVI